MSCVDREGESWVPGPAYLHKSHFSPVSCMCMGPGAGAPLLLLPHTALPCCNALRCVQLRTTGDNATWGLRPEMLASLEQDPPPELVALQSRLAALWPEYRIAHMPADVLAPPGACSAVMLCLQHSCVLRRPEYHHWARARVCVLRNEKQEHPCCGQAMCAHCPCMCPCRGCGGGDIPVVLRGQRGHAGRPLRLPR